MSLCAHAVVRPYLHTPQSLVFTTESFSRITSFATSSLNQSLPFDVCYAADLYFITRDSGYDNLTSKDTNLIIHRLASDLEFDDNLSDEEPLNNLRVAMLSHSPRELTTSEVLELFEVAGLPNQIIVIGNSS